MPWLAIAVQVSCGRAGLPSPPQPVELQVEVPGQGGRARERTRGDSYGASFAILPDRDGDGWKNIAVGSPTHDGGAVYEFSGNPLRELSQIDAPAGTVQFGQILAPIDDLDADESSDLFVAAPDWFGRNDPDRVMAFSMGTRERLLGSTQLEGEEVFLLEIAALGDIDADRTPDVLILVQRGRSEPGTQCLALLVVAAKSGAELRAHVGERRFTGAERTIAGLDDQNGDSIADYAACLERDGRGALVLFSGLDGSELAVLESPTPAIDVTGPIVVGGDQDGDGVADLSFGCTERVERGYGHCRIRSYSLQRRETIRDLLVPAQELIDVVALPDQDGDGIDELLVGVPDDWGAHEKLGSVNGGALILDGSTGEPLARFTGPMTEHPARGRQLAVVDLNGDGELEIVMSRYSPYTGGEGVVVVHMSDAAALYEPRHR